MAPFFISTSPAVSDKGKPPFVTESLFKEEEEGGGGGGRRRAFREATGSLGSRLSFELSLLLLRAHLFFRPYPKDAIVSNLLNCPGASCRLPSHNFFLVLFLCSHSIQALWAHSPVALTGSRCGKLVCLMARMSSPLCLWFSAALFRPSVCLSCLLVLF